VLVEDFGEFETDAGVATGYEMDATFMMVSVLERMDKAGSFDLSDLGGSSL
jgi:hypothetical protein